MSKRRLVVRILVPTSSFLAGIFIPIIIDRLTKGLNNETQLTLLSFLGSILALITMIIVISIYFIETHEGHKEILAKIEAATRQFGLLVHFIEENPDKNEGETYEMSKRLIEGAQTSLVFLDAWSQTNAYAFGTSIGSGRRQAYYDAIINQIEKHKYDSIQFHRRIIQIPDLATEKFILKSGEVFLKYLKKSLKLQSSAPKACIIRIAPLQIAAQFLIVDERYVVWPILTYNPKGGVLRRHGAIFFDDPLGQFVPQMMAIYNMIDAKSQPFEAHHLGVNTDEEL